MQPGKRTHKLAFLVLPPPWHVLGMVASEYPYAEIGARVRALRTHLGFSVKDFADMNSWGATQLTNWEQGHRRITVEAAVKLRQRYDIPLDWLYLGIESALPQNMAKALSSKPSDKS